MKKLVIFGASSFAEIAQDYFQSSNFEVIAHVIDPGFETSINSVSGIPVVVFGSSEFEKTLNKAEYFYIASTYTQLNRLRSRKFNLFRSLGLKPASYVSPHAYIHKSAKLGEHLFIFENNVIQLGVQIEDNCILWSGNHIGHHSKIETNVFISSHVVISGHVTIGANSFLGVNSTIQNNVLVGKDNWISPNVLITKNTLDNSLYRSSPGSLTDIKPVDYFKVGIED